IIGLHSDWFIKEYKGSFPIIPFEDRKIILEELRMVDCVIEINSWEVPNSVDIVTHGDGWCPKYIRNNNQTLVIIPRYNKIDTTKIKERVYDYCKCRGCNNC
ncbi:MAG: hypothetical protein KKB37_17415, partial [Alphaproteobacteria bacterium]|nr:hypothetical protein [Alphaproteobacteria bacterium]